MDSNKIKQIKQIGTAILIVIAIAIVLFGCTTSKDLYKIGEQWRPGPSKSMVTGWSYKK